MINITRFWKHLFPGPSSSISSPQAAQDGAENGGCYQSQSVPFCSCCSFLLRRKTPHSPSPQSIPPTGDSLPWSSATSEVLSTVCDTPSDGLLQHRLLSESQVSSAALLCIHSFTGWRQDSSALLISECCKGSACRVTVGEGEWLLQNDSPPPSSLT